MLAKLGDLDTTTIVLVVLAALTLLVLAGAVAIFLWPWRVDISAKATTNEQIISMAAGVDVAGISASAAGILDGPGVVAIHFRGRERWRRVIPRVSPEALLDWLDARPKSEKKEPSWLMKRTDTSELPDLGVRVFLDLREVTLAGALVCGFSDPILTGKTAAVLYPLAGLLGPFGELEVSFDWSGKTRIDGGIDVSFRVVLARVVRELARFARKNVRLRATTPPTTPPSSTTLPAASTTR